MKLTYRERLVCKINAYVSYMEVCAELGRPLTAAEAEACITPPADVHRIAPKITVEHIKVASNTFSLIALSTTLNGPEATLSAVAQVVAKLRQELATLPDEGPVATPALFFATSPTESTKKAN